MVHVSLEHVPIAAFNLKGLKGQSGSPYNQNHPEDQAVRQCGLRRCDHLAPLHAFPLTSLPGMTSTELSYLSQSHLANLRAIKKIKGV